LSSKLHILAHPVYTKTNSVALSPQAKYTDWATATFRWNLMPTFADGGLLHGQRGGSPAVVNLCFLNRSLYFFFRGAPQLSSWVWVYRVPEPLLCRKFGSAGNRSQDLCVSSQKLWPLDHRGGHCIYIYIYSYIYICVCIFILDYDRNVCGNEGTVKNYRIFQGKNFDIFTRNTRNSWISGFVIIEAM
jgi:hypothetical protein